MDQETVVIKIRDYDPLCISVSRLTADSRLFRYLICELHFTELEMDDFHPDTVGIFLALLEDKTADDIQEGHFRELHKMSVVFEVDWLVESCREWLVNKIHDIGNDRVVEYKATLYLVEESRYILNKWGLRKFVDILTSKLAAKDNEAFISEYMADFDKLVSDQLDMMLKLGGSNTKVFLEIVLQNITGKQFLDTNTKYLLENINLVFCLEQNQQLYEQMFQTLSAMSELTTTDLRFIFKLSTESAVTAYSSNYSFSSRNTKISSTAIWDGKEWKALRKGCVKLEDIVLRVEDQRVNDMFVVVSLLLEVIYSNPPAAEEAEVFINRLENVCRDKPLRKVFPQYIDSIISLLKLSDREGKVQLIALLEKIKNNNKLSSCHDYIILDIDDSKRVEVTRTVKLFPVEFKHPIIPSECGMPGKCGLVIKRSYDKGYDVKIELSKEKADYEGTGFHYHDVFSAEDMHYLELVSYTTQDGTKGRVYSLQYVVSLYDVLWLLRRWVPSSTNWRYNKRCIAYDISKHLVAKQD